jgi:hypothetical protein
MSKKYLWFALVFSLVSFLFCGGVWLYQKSQTEDLMRGEYAFIASKNNLRQIGRIQMITPENGEINIYRRDGLWYFKEAKDYFANVERLSTFFKIVNEALIERSDAVSAADLHHMELDENGMILRTYDLNNQLLDAVVLGARLDKDSIYMRPEKSNDRVYLIGPVGAFSGHPMDWIPYPLLAVNYDRIEKLIIRRHLLNREKIEKRIISSPAMRQFILTLKYVDYSGLVYKEDVLEDNTLSVEMHPIEVVMDNGLIYALNVYRVQENSYWLGITLKADKISRAEVGPFIAQNQKYYADWLFQLNDEQGRILFNL